MKKNIFIVLSLLLTATGVSAQENQQALQKQTENAEVMGPPSNRPIVNASFSPRTTTAGKMVTFRWSSRNAYMCRVSGVPGVPKRPATSGSSRFKATKSLKATVRCDGYNDRVTTKIARLTVSDNSKPPVVSASFSPSQVTPGASTTFRWSATNATRCSSTGLVRISGTSGSRRLKPAKSGSVRVTCTGAGGSASKSASVTVKYKNPTVSISFPHSVFAKARYQLRVSSTNAKSCTFKYSDKSYPKNIGTSLVENLIYSSAGVIYQTAKCTGLNGKVVTSRHKVVVVNKVVYPPKIKSFINGDVINGQTKLYWSTSNADRCTLKSGSVSSNVPVNAYGYGATIPYNGRTFTLTCYGGNKSVSKNLFVPRPRVKKASGEVGLVEPMSATQDMAMDASTMSELDRQMVSDLANFEIDLNQRGVTHVLADLNADDYADLVIHRSSDNKLFVLISNNGTFDSIAREMSEVYGLEEVLEIHVDGQEVERVDLDLETTIIE